MPRIVGILNLSPDSFSDGSIYDKVALQERIETLIADGAEIIDVGAESTAPNSQPISHHEEWGRLELFFSIIDDYSDRVIFSLDTKKSSIAKKWVEQWIQIINDVSGGRSDENMYALIAQYPQIKYVCMYAKNTHGHADLDEQKNVWNIVADVESFFDAQIWAMKERGIQDHQIILDPGMWAFISTLPSDSIKILRHISKWRKKYTYPLFCCTSRKGFLGAIAQDVGTHDRIGSSLATALYMYQMDTDYIRVHDVRETAHAFSVQKALNESIEIS